MDVLIKQIEKEGENLKEIDPDHRYFQEYKFNTIKNRVDVMREAINKLLAKPKSSATPSETFTPFQTGERHTAIQGLLKKHHAIKNSIDRTINNILEGDNSQDKKNQKLLETYWEKYTNNYEEIMAIVDDDEAEAIEQ